MLDALLPFVEKLERRVSEGERWQQAWAAAEQTAKDAARATPPTCDPGWAGPAHWPNAASGPLDAGATLLAMCARTVAESLDVKGDSPQ